MLNANQRREAYGLLVMMFVGMLLEMLGVGLVVPVIVLLMQQDPSVMPSALRPVLDVLGPLPREHLVMGAMVALVTVYSFKSI
ncbi:hypothetical protein RZS08_65055, partial [Arthrospira platensis SPKY1]|nr:hypothetical protein [Arthrospira platensis SPKY1]